MNYLQAVEYIESFGVFGIKAGLERIEHLLARLGNPHNKLKCIHVAGTNGKGSVCTILEALLKDFKIAKFTSPHLVNYNERFCINGNAISDAEFAGLVAKLYPIIADMPSDLKPTQFELLTAMAFEYFAACGVDYAIIEVGLGGLLDSTNVITPVISVITNVDMDHMDKCGDTLSAIARHKAGIIKAGIPIITAASGEPLSVIKSTAEDLGSRILVYGNDFEIKERSWKTTANGSFEQQFTYIYSMSDSSDVRIPAKITLLGEHQLLNTAVAITAVGELLGWSKLLDAVHNLYAAHWSGRLEVVSYEPIVILDGAHNLAGAQVLRQTIDTLFANKKICFILGFMQDKDIVGILQNLIRDNDMVIPIVADPNYSRSAPIRMIMQYIDATQYPLSDLRELEYEQALQLAKEHVGSDGLVCIAGSLYLIGRLKQKNIF